MAEKLFDQNLLSEVIDQSHNPPGSDPILGNFYAALVEMIESGHPIAYTLMRVKNRRLDITYKHLVNLIFRAYQAIKFEQNDLSYRSFDSITKWLNELKSLMSDPIIRRYFAKLLRTKSTTTTIYQRYSGPYAIVSYLWDSRLVSIADLGCGGNYGLRGIELKESFRRIKDLTSKKLLTKFLRRKINLQIGLAIDKENPDEKDVKAWRLACSFYPRELNELNSIQAFEERLRLSQKVSFLQANLLSSRKLPKNCVNVAILSSILYQLSLTDQLTLIDKARKLLKRGGIIIVQDFAVKNLANPTHLDFNESWFGKSYSYRTFILGAKTSWKFWELFQWNNGRCRSVKMGEDFDKIFKITPSKFQLKTANAAFAHSTS